MSNMVGSDPDELDRVGITIERSGRRIAASGKRLGNALNNAPWHGPNADRFRQEYQSVHSKAIAEAAAFLDDAYETLRRNATQQRNASESGRRSPWNELIGRIRRGIGWFPPFGGPRFPAPPWWGPFDPRRWRFPHLPDGAIRMPKFPMFPDIVLPKEPWWHLPRDPRHFLPDLRPIDPSDWVDDIIIGGGAAGAAVAGWISGIFGPGHAGNGDGATPTQTPSTPTPSTPTPTTPPPPAAPAQTGAVDVASKYIGTSRPAIENGTAMGASGQCVMWVRSWLKEAGLPTPGPGTPFGSLDAVGDQVATPQAGDVFQRARTDGTWNGAVHTALVKSYDPATGKITLIEGNVPAGSGKVIEGNYASIKALQRTDGTEVRFYRMGGS